MTSIELKTPTGDTVVLERNGQFNVTKWGKGCSDRFGRIYHIGNWLNLEWWPTVFNPDYFQLTVEDIADLPELI